MYNRKSIPELVEKLETYINENEGKYVEEAKYIFLLGINRAKDLRENLDYSFSNDSDAVNYNKKFLNILREGPEVGVHFIVWSDSLSNLIKIISRHKLDEFENRIVFQMDQNSSSTLIDSDAAFKLGYNRALVYNDDSGLFDKFRPYEPIDKQRIKELIGGWPNEKQ